MQTQKAIRYSVNTCPICDFTLGKAWRSIAALSWSLSFLCVKRTVWYGFRAGAKAIRYSVNTCPICDFTLGKAWRSIAALSLSLSFLCVKRSPIWYGFRAGAKAIWYSVNTYSICDFTLEKAWRSIAALQKSRWNHRSYAWTEAQSGMVFAPAQEVSGVVRTWLNSWVVLLFVWKFHRSHDKLFVFISSMLEITPELSCLIHWSQFVTCLTEQEVTRSWKNVQLPQRKVTLEVACKQALHLGETREVTREEHAKGSARHNRRF